MSEWALVLGGAITATLLWVLVTATLQVYGPLTLRHRHQVDVAWPPFDTFAVLTEHVWLVGGRAEHVQHASCRHCDQPVEMRWTSPDFAEASASPAARRLGAAAAAEFAVRAIRLAARRARA